MGNKDSKSPRGEKEKKGLFGSSKSSQPVSKLSPEEIENMRQRRLKILQELLQTERVYVGSLNDIYYKWQKPLEDQAEGKNPPATKEQIRIIFSNIGELLKIHTELLQTLSAKMEKFDDKTNISEVFLKNAHSLKLYTDYVNNFNISMATIKTCEQNKNFTTFVTTISVQNNNGVQFTLGGLMIQPVQRIPRYVMILEDLIKNTWDIHTDLASLQAACEEIKKVATYINEQKREFENTERMNALQVKLGKKAEIAKPGRKIVWEGEVQVLSKDKKKLEELPIVQCMVCNDAILIYQEIEEVEEQKNKKSGIGGFFKATSGKLSDSSPGVKVYLFGLCTSLTLDLGGNDEIELSEDAKTGCVFKITETGFARAQWTEMWTINAAKEKKGKK